MSSPFEEERALLGKEQRKPRQVGAPRVDFGFGEVGVDRARREHVRADALADVEARLKVAFDARVAAPECRRRRSPPAGRVSPTPRSKSGRSVSSPARLVCVIWYWRVRRRPAIGFEPPLNAALDVELPLVQAGLEGERLHRNPDLGAPAGRQSRGRRLPDAVPVGVVALAARIDQRRRSARRSGSRRTRSRIGRRANGPSTMRT